MDVFLQDIVSFALTANIILLHPSSHLLYSYATSPGRFLQDIVSFALTANVILLHPSSHLLYSYATSPDV